RRCSRCSSGAASPESACCRGVAEVQYAGLECLCAQQLEPDARLVRWEEPSQALADSDRVYEQVELVEEALAQEPADRGGAAGHGDVATILSLDVSQLSGYVAADDLR